MPNLVTSWPYTDRDQARQRAEADVQTTRPYLRDPRRTAVAFLQEFVGTNVTLRAGRTSAFQAGIRVEVSKRARQSGKVIPMTSVYLVRCRIGDDAPYVVVSAGSDMLSITSPISGDRLAQGAFTIYGRVTGVDESIAVGLHRLDGTRNGTVFTPGGGTNTPWQAVLPGSRPGHAVILATTSDPSDGTILRVAAVPVQID